MTEENHSLSCVTLPTLADHKALPEIDTDDKNKMLAGLWSWGLQPDDEEWKEFEQKEVDYSGLRVHALQLSDEKEEEEYEKEEMGEDGEMVMISGGDKISGPWNKSAPTPTAAAPVGGNLRESVAEGSPSSRLDEKEEEEYEKEEMGEDGEMVMISGGDKISGPWNKSAATPTAAAPIEVEVPEPKPSGVYRPPGARLTTTKRGPAQGPPEIFSDTQFPSLQSTAKHVETKKDREMEKTFETVKHKNRAREEGGGKGPSQQLQLDNQYAVLEDK
ncbi:UNVERIFIED_CONTAM: hypothetical protein FKN15_042846 [Acipenser sinensis]